MVKENVAAIKKVSLAKASAAKVNAAATKLRKLAKANAAKVSAAARSLLKANAVKASAAVNHQRCLICCNFKVAPGIGGYFSPPPSL